MSEPEINACGCGLTINAIVKSRWETGAYGDVHFVMPESTWTALPRPEPDPNALPSFGPNLGSLLAIPIRRDDSLAPGTWRLRANTDNLVIHEGRPS